MCRALVRGFVFRSLARGPVDTKLTSSYHHRSWRLIQIAIVRMGSAYIGVRETCFRLSSGKSHR